MKRITLMVVRLLYIVPIWLYKIWKYSKDGNYEKYDDVFRYNFLQKITTRVNRAGRVTVTCSGLENLPKDNGFVIFPNHQGLFDGLVFLETLGRPFSIIMKKEVENTFLVKQVRLIIGAKIMDRDDVRQSMKIIKEISNEVKEGKNYIIFAEGTRSRKGNEILSFKGGAFKSAVYAKAPIVPAALIDAFKAFDTHSIKKITVQVHYLKPIEYEEYKDMKTREITGLVEERIRQAIKENIITD